nr:hypothetical protein [Tanacetum cinerariifolium]
MLTASKDKNAPQFANHGSEIVASLVEVYSLISDSWKIVHNDVPLMVSQNVVAFHKGVFYWRGFKGIRPCIMSFNLDDEMFSEIEQPLLDTSCSLLAVKASSDSLLAVYSKSNGGHSGVLELWKMDENGRGWMKAYTIQCNRGVGWTIGFTRSNKFLYATLEELLVSFDLESLKTEFHDVGIPFDRFAIDLSYTPGLLLTIFALVFVLGYACKIRGSRMGISSGLGLNLKLVNFKYKSKWAAEPQKVTEDLLLSLLPMASHPSTLDLEPMATVAGIVTLLDIVTLMKIGEDGPGFWWFFCYIFITSVVPSMPSPSTKKHDLHEREKKLAYVSINALVWHALKWHKQFMRRNGDNVTWHMYEEGIKERFDPVNEDPMVELKNLKQVGSVQAYQDLFEALLNKVDQLKAYAISLFIGGLKKEIGLCVRMFKLNKLVDVYCLAKMQEVTLAIFKNSGQIYCLEVIGSDEIMEDEECELSKQEPVTVTEVEGDTMP